MNRPPKRHVPLQVQISTVVLTLVLLVAGAVGGYGYFSSRKLLERSTSDLVARISHDTHQQFNQTSAVVSMAVNVLARTSLGTAQTEQQRIDRLPLMREILRRTSAITSVYAAYESGDFFMLRRVNTDADRIGINSPDGTRYVLQVINRNVEPSRGKFVFMDEDLRILREDDKPGYPGSYDARSRSWYEEALREGKEVIGDPYIFFTTGKVGLTVSAPVEDTRTVVAADVRLNALDNLLAAQRLTPHTQLALVTGDAQIVSLDDIDRVLVRTTDKGESLKLIDLQESGLPVISSLAPIVKSLRGADKYAGTTTGPGGKWRVIINPIQLGTADLYYLVMTIPEQELMAESIHQRNLSIAITVILLVLAVPVTFLVAHAISRPVRALAKEAEAIRRFDFSNPVQVQSSILEVDKLASTIDGMKQTIRRFLSISESVASVEDLDDLMPLLLSDTIAAAEAEAGVLYLLDDHTLNPAAALTSTGASIVARLSSFRDDAGIALMNDALKTTLPAIGRLEDDDLGSLGLDCVPDVAQLSHAVVIPLLNRNHQLVGALLLLSIEPFDTAHVAFIKALSGAAAGSLETRELIRAQKALFQAFIQLIASAIDSKSPYTGGHCARVPELTSMLAEAACQQTSGPFADFSLSDQDREAVHVASWLHDCGKITTPEFVVDKATKLETIYDRIHEVRMRFEVLKRDAEIACLKAIARGDDEASARDRFARELQTLDDEFAFVAACNEGGEFMAPESCERLRKIAARTWQRTLDDRIGISEPERERKARKPRPTLPATEHLLEDKPEHRIERTSDAHTHKDNPYGFRMSVPELLYNKGELYNLTISRGTLTDEDRYKINDHIVQTLIMLSTLPFPKHMRNVAEIAGGHHEKVDGSGYPKRLTRDEMSPVARMMAIADIFEALTATDRPYKKGKTLSEAIKIMFFMKKDQHIDPDLFDLFLRSGIYRVYAERYMNPEQIDDVDVDRYLDPLPATEPAWGAATADDPRTLSGIG